MTYLEGIVNEYRTSLLLTHFKITSEYEQAKDRILNSGEEGILEAIVELDKIYNARILDYAEREARAKENDSA